MLMADESDSALLENAIGGDAEAFRVLYFRHRDPVFRFAYRLLGREGLAEDVTHDCFVSLLRKPTAFDARRASLRTYLCAAARHLALKQLRRQGVQVALDQLAPEPASLGEGPLQALLSRERSEQVAEAVGRLPYLQREALVLFEYEEMSLAEIAGLTGVDPGTISGRLHRAREGLRRWLLDAAGPSARPLPRRVP